MYHKLDMYFHNVQMCLVEKHHIPFDHAGTMVSDLSWYTDTGRASVEWCKRLLETKPYLVARRLVKGGSTNEIIKRVTGLIMKKGE